MPARRLLLLVSLALALVLTGCSGSSGPSSTRSSSAGGGLPTVAGSYGQKPTFTFPKTNPPAALKSAVLREGNGPAVKKGDLLVADYLGQVWQGAVFDNSYDRKAPSGFVIGAGMVIPGWDQVLVGAKVGSRVLMSIPPAQGYGTSGNPRGGIKGTDTLEFVVDIVASYGNDAAGDPKAAPQSAATPGIVIGGALGAAPRVKVGKTARPPTSARLVVLAKGSGTPVSIGLLVLQYVATRYNGVAAGSSYSSAPAAFTLSGRSAAQNPFEQLRGVPLGSRVLLELPASAGHSAIAVVVDLIAQPKPAAQAG